MKEINENTKLSVVYHLPELKPIEKYLIYSRDFKKLKLFSHVGNIKKVEPNGNLLYGLERVREVMKAGAKTIPIYTDEECKDDLEKKEANILYFPPLKEDTTKPIMFVAAGGAYAIVCSLLEAYPVARRFNELGYPVFVLNYRVNNENGLFPKPMEDLAHAISYVYSHAEEFQLSGDRGYGVCGFSAGGHITAEWGTDNEGFLKYGLPSPRVLVMGYAAISSRYFVSDDVKAMVKFRESIVGNNYTDEMEERFSADCHVHKAYPPSYIVLNADDDMVDPKHSHNMKAALDEYNVPNVMEEGEKGGHGFGAGFNTSVEGWIDRADEFISHL